jgi:N4-gp56 family major capsid protein
MAGFVDTGGSVTASALDNKTLYKAVYLKNREPQLVFQQFAQKQNDMDIPLAKGDNVEFTRYAPLEDSATYHKLTEGINPDAEKLYAQTVTAIVLEYGNYVKPSSLKWLTAFDPKLGGVSRLLGVQAGKDLNLKIQNVLAEGFIGMRADADTSYQGEVIATGGGTATVPEFDDLPGGVSSGETGVIVFTSGRNEGLTRTYTYASDTTLTLASALPYIPADNDTARMCATDALTTGDKITPAIIKKAVALLEEQEAPLFPDGYYHAVIPKGRMKLDFMNDDEYINLKHYAAPKDLYRNLMGEFHNVRFHTDTNPYRHTAATIGTRVKAGAVYMVSIFGSDAFGNIKLAGIDQKYYINPPPPEGTTTNPLGRFGTIGWLNIFAPIVLNGAWGVNIFCVPTAL